VIVTLSGFSWESFNKEDAVVKIFPRAELGFTKVLEHTIQLGDPESTDPFNYVTQGGQEILFLFQRYSLDVEIAKRHTVTFLYQPLTLETKTVVPENRTGGLTIEDRTYAAGTGLDLKYGFDFWRVSYRFSIIRTEAFDLGAGLSLQLRNASIVFSGTEGNKVRVNQNLGPVPILKIGTEYRFPFGLFLGAEIDGFYASSKLFNGADFDFTGWIYDGALRVGMDVNELTDLFVSFRVLGGGARGTSEYEKNYWTDSVSGITDNSLTTLIISAGARIK
jgi:hypothetical protein